MKQDLSLSCSCGTLRGWVRGASPQIDIRLVCLCDDCQAYAHYLGKAREVLDTNGGTEVYQTVPAKLQITEGMEQLRCLRLSGKGMYRWYAGCCKTPLANTLPSAKIPFAGLVHTIIQLPADAKPRDKVLGPIRARVQGRYGLGKLAKGTHQSAPLGIVFRIVRLMGLGWLRAQHKPSPFFDSQTGKPRVEPYVLSSAEREGLRPLCGPSTSQSVGTSR